MTRRRRRCWSSSWSYMRALVVPCVCVCVRLSALSALCVCLCRTRSCCVLPSKSNRKTERENKTRGTAESVRSCLYIVVRALTRSDVSSGVCVCSRCCARLFFANRCGTAGRKGPAAALSRRVTIFRRGSWPHPVGRRGARFASACPCRRRRCALAAVNV